MVNKNRTSTSIAVLSIGKNHNLDAITDLFNQFIGARGFSLNLCVAADLKAGRRDFLSEPYNLVLIDEEAILKEQTGLLNQKLLSSLFKNCLILATTSDFTTSKAFSFMQFGAHECLDLKAPVKELHQKLQTHWGAYLANIGEQNQSAKQYFIGQSDAMQDIYKLIERIAPSHANVFISGENGTGKTLCAESIHKLSSRANENFISLDCKHYSENDLNHQLFNSKGVLNQAEGGTLLLKNVDELSLNLQAKLLHIIQNGSFATIDNIRLNPLNIRLICTTDADILTHIQRKTFREDLYYRLNVLHLKMPKLTKRKDDIQNLAHYFLNQANENFSKNIAGFDASAIELLKAYNWPNNVVELAQTIHSLVKAENCEYISAKAPILLQLAQKMSPVNQDYRSQPFAQHHQKIQNMLQTNPPQYSKNSNDGLIGKACENMVKGQQITQKNGFIGHSKAAYNLPLTPLWQQEQIIIENTIAFFNGNIAKAAASLEISPSTIYRKRESWEQLAARSAQKYAS